MSTPALTALPRLDARTSTWLTHAGQPVLGERHLAILEGVSAFGSLNAAAKQLKISYRDAWGQIRHAETALGVGLVAARAGGRRGGGSRLTLEGEQLVARLRAFHREQRQATARGVALYFGDAPQPALRDNGERLLLATTTSLVDTGLLALLLVPFTKRVGMAVEVFAVGSGVALRLARAGDADVVLTHAPSAEERSLLAGDTVNRRPVLTNEFILVGPPDDPAGVRAVRDVHAALRRIAAARVPFLSRADESGTNQRERSLLAAARVRPGRWYQRGHCGMAELLRGADATRGYTLSDCGTFAAVADELSLDVLCGGGAELMNSYSVSATNPHRHEGANYLAAMELVGWLTSPAAQEMIAAYRVAGRAVAQPASNGRPVRRARR
ncbi:MAG: substrate-binding domain-containing protein [Candidatus Binatia bacterium]